MSKSLKPAMYYSILLLVFTVICSMQLQDVNIGNPPLYFMTDIWDINPFSYRMPALQTDPLSGKFTEKDDEHNQTPEHTGFSEVENQAPVLPESVWDAVPGVRTSKVFHSLTEKVIAIAKPELLTGMETTELMDYAVDRQLQFAIKGINTEQFAFMDIIRVVQEELYSNAVAAPSPSPTPTPPAGEEEEEPYPSDYVPVYIPEELPEPPLTDPVQSQVISYVKEEDGTTTASVLFHLNRTYVYEFLEDENYYYICLLRPKDVYDKIVVIDAGHGFGDSGTYSAGYEYLEKDMNLSILLQIRQILEEEESIKAYYTRTTDRRLTFNQRINLANDLEADFFISIHCNSGSLAASGTEVLYSDKQDQWTGMNSKRFAQICLEEILPGTGLPNRGIQPRSYDVHVINAALVPMALIETAFMTNTNDLSILVLEETHKAVAEGLFRALQRAYQEMEDI